MFQGGLVSSLVRLIVCQHASIQIYCNNHTSQAISHGRSSAPAKPSQHTMQLISDSSVSSHLDSAGDCCRLFCDFRDWF